MSGHDGRSDTSSSDGDAPPVLRILPTAVKRALRAPSPTKRSRPERTAALHSPPRRPFAPAVGASDELERVLPPSDWEPPLAAGAVDAAEDVPGYSSPPAAPAAGATAGAESAVEKDTHEAAHTQALGAPFSRAPVQLASSPSRRAPVSGQAPSSAQASPRPRAPHLRFASPPVSVSPPTSPRLGAGPGGTNVRPWQRKPSLSGHPIPDLSANPEPARAEGAPESSPESSPRNSPQAARALTNAPLLRQLGSSSPYGAQRSPRKSALLSPARPLTMQMHYLMALGLDSESNAEAETLADELTLFGNELDASLAPVAAASREQMTLESAEAPVLWQAIRDCHARGRALLEEVLEQRQRRVLSDELPGGYARFKALERQGVEAAIVERQKERCLTLRSRATSVQQLYLELREQVWALEHQKAEADLLQAQLGTQLPDLEDLEVLAAELENEEAEVQEAEAETDAAEAAWQAEQDGVTGLIGENKAGLDELSNWLLDESPTEREQRARQAVAASRQQLTALERELGLTISVGSSSRVAYVATDFLGIRIDLATRSVAFALRHPSTPVYDHYVRHLASSSASNSASLRELLHVWREGLEVQKAVNALARFGTSSFETVGGTLLYKQRLQQPSGELTVRLDNAVVAVDAVIDDGGDAVRAGMDARPAAAVLESVVRRLHAFRQAVVARTEP